MYICTTNGCLPYQHPVSWPSHHITPYHPKSPMPPYVTPCHPHSPSVTPWLPYLHPVPGPPSRTISPHTGSAAAGCHHWGLEARNNKQLFESRLAKVPTRQSDKEKGILFVTCFRCLWLPPPPLLLGVASSFLSFRSFRSSSLVLLAKEMKASGPIWRNSQLASI